ncbi:hypothetical protein D3C77_457080 [compost metagenome]
MPALDYKVSNVRPQALLTKLDDPRFVFTPITDRQQALVTTHIDQRLRGYRQRVRFHYGKVIAVVSWSVRTQSFEGGIDKSATHRTEMNCLRQTEAQVNQIQLKAISFIGEQPDLLSQHFPGVLQNGVNFLIMRLH